MLSERAIEILHIAKDQPFAPQNLDDFEEILILEELALLDPNTGQTSPLGRNLIDMTDEDKQTRKKLRKALAIVQELRETLSKEYELNVSLGQSIIGLAAANQLFSPCPKTGAAICRCLKGSSTGTTATAGTSKTTEHS